MSEKSKAEISYYTLRGIVGEMPQERRESIHGVFEKLEAVRASVGKEDGDVASVMFAMKVCSEISS